MTIKEAIEKARTLVPELFPDVDRTSIRLEGAELSDDDRFWLVTYSFMDDSTATDAKTLSDLYKFMHIRAYKTFKLSAANGELKGFRNGLADAA